MAPERMYLTSVTGGSCSIPPEYTYAYATHSPYTWFYGPSKIKKYIINENATIIFWNDGSKTVSKRHKDDKFDKELGFLFAYFYKKYDGSNASRKRVIDCIDYKKIKTFLFEFYVNDTDKTPEEARKYLSNLKVDKK